MTRPLVAKVVRDLRLPLLGVALLLAAYQCFWVRITQRITGQLVPLLVGLAKARSMSKTDLEAILFEGPGKMVRMMMGGENIGLERAMDILSIGYVHPVVQTILCIWAIGRSSGAIAGEIDRGTMELLMAQPLQRNRVVLSWLFVDILTIPILCLSMWAGTYVGTWMVGPIVLSEEIQKLPFQETIEPEKLRLEPAAFGPALWNVGALIFAVSGYTMWLSAAGRFRWKVMGIAVFITLIQFLINLLGQLWDTIAALRPLTVFFYYQPQQIVLMHRWSVDLGTVWGRSHVPYSLNVMAVLLSVGFIGYGMALWTFSRRDLPAPL